MQAQREFVGNVAHELRTPLAGIRALAEYGLAQHDTSVWREQLVRVSERQGRASHLIDQLLALALAEEARTELKRVPVRLDVLAEQTVLRHLARADARGVDLGARGLDDGVVVHANEALVEGILDNLIDNALRYGGHTITVELAGRTLSVIDDGPGIPLEAQRDLMQRWSQGPAGEKLGQGCGPGPVDRVALCGAAGRRVAARSRRAHGPACERGLRRSRLNLLPRVHSGVPWWNAMRQRPARQRHSELRSDCAPGLSGMASRRTW